jgi:hypothetical protein
MGSGKPDFLKVVCIARPLLLHVIHACHKSQFHIFLYTLLNIYGIYSTSCIFVPIPNTPTVPKRFI